jgi:hypothetical protein
MTDSVRAYILMSTQSGREFEVAEKNTEAAQRSECTLRVWLSVYGLFDILVQIECNDIRVIDYNVFALKKLEGVTSTMTLIVQQ